MNDSDLILSFQNGSEKSFKLIFDRYYLRLFSFGFKLIGDKCEVEDMVLVTFQSLFSNCIKFESLNKIQAFLYVTMKNKCHNYNAKEKHIVSNSYDEQTQDSEKLAYEFEIKHPLVESIHTVINDFPKQMRLVFKLLFFEELPPSEVSKQLGITTQTVYAQKERGLNKLKKAFPNLKLNT